MADFHLDGLDRFERALHELEARAEEAARRAVVEAAHLVEARAKSNAPVVTGTLRRSLHVEGPRSLGRSTFKALIGPSVLYGRRVELGFHGEDSLGRRIEQEGRPYLRPALDEVLAEVHEIYRRAWARVVRT